eukprot:Clim_evm46s88 gene=Clim_evmTU46s88
MVKGKDIDRGHSTRSGLMKSSMEHSMESIEELVANTSIDSPNSNLGEKQPLLSSPKDLKEGTNGAKPKKNAWGFAAHSAISKSDTRTSGSSLTTPTLIEPGHEHPGHGEERILRSRLTPGDDGDEPYRADKARMKSHGSGQGGASLSQPRIPRPQSYGAFLSDFGGAALPPQQTNGGPSVYNANGGQITWQGLHIPRQGHDSAASSVYGDDESIHTNMGRAFGGSITPGTPPWMDPEMGEFPDELPEDLEEDDLFFRPGQLRKMRDDLPYVRLVNRRGGFNLEQVNLPFMSALKDMYHHVLDISWYKLLPASLVIYILINLVFAVMYWVVDGIEQADSFVDCFFFSIQTQDTIGYGVLSPRGAGNYVVMVQSWTSILINAFVTGLVFAKISRPSRMRRKILFSRRAVINCTTATWRSGRRAEKSGEYTTGVPCLTFRIGNMRHKSQLVDTQLHLLFLRLRRNKARERVPCNEPYEIQELNFEVNRQDLRVRNTSMSAPLLALPWTVVHRIDENSPLFGMTREDLLRIRAEIIPVLDGIDEACSDNFQARWSYTANEIMWNHTYEPIITVKNLKFCVDYSKFHNTKLLPPELQRRFPSLWGSGRFRGGLLSTAYSKESINECEEPDYVKSSLSSMQNVASSSMISAMQQGFPQGHEPNLHRDMIRRMVNQHQRPQSLKVNMLRPQMNRTPSYEAAAAVPPRSSVLSPRSDDMGSQAREKGFTIHRQPSVDSTSNHSLGKESGGKETGKEHET